MHKFLLIVTLFILSGCEYHCIKPESLSNLREKLDVVSTEQKWVDSGVHISGSVKVTEISIVPSKVNFCPKRYEDFAIQPGKNSVTLSRFSLKEGDAISFSVIGSKVCKKKADDTEIRYVRIDEKCSDEEKEYFAHVLNQNECQAIWRNEEYKYTICPNKLMIGSAEWLPGQEYWDSDFSKLDQDEKRKKTEEIKNIINSIKQGENIDCSKLSDNQASKIDTYILNLACQKTCCYFSKNCVEIESNTIDGGNLAIDLGKALVAAEDKASEIIKATKKIAEKGIETYIPSLVVSMQKESFNVWTNYDYKVGKDHPQGEKLTFTLACEEQCRGGYNIRVTRTPSPEDDLYIHVSDKFPEHNPGENQADISVDINRVHDIEYMEGLKDKLKNKSGTIYYGIRDHGCDYKENEGQFSINLTTKEPPTRTFSVIYNFFDEKVKTAFFGSSYKDPNAVHSESSPVKSLYQSFVASNRTKTIRSTIVSLLVLYIVLYTLYYFFGLTHVSIYEFLIICVKIGVITQLLRDNSWDFFYNNAFSIFINTPKQLIEIANFRGTTSNVFEFLDLPLNRFLSSHSVLLIISLIFSGPLGIVSFCLVIWGLIIVVLSIFNALFSFVTSIAIVALLLSLTPIFIICLLFTYTRQMFHNWVKNLARFAIHPVVLLISISLVSQVMDYIVYSVFDFEVCTTCIINIDLKIFKFCIFHGYASKYTPNIAAMMVFVILGHATKTLIEASSKISDSLFGAYVMSDPGKQYQQSLLGVVGLDEQSVQGRRMGAAQQSSVPSQGPKVPPRPHAAQGLRLPAGDSNDK
jgi:type IV secretion system protein VirB6